MSYVKNPRAGARSLFETNAAEQWKGTEPPDKVKGFEIDWLVTCSATLPVDASSAGAVRAAPT